MYGGVQKHLGLGFDSVSIVRNGGKYLHGVYEFPSYSSFHFLSLPAFSITYNQEQAQ